MSNQSARRAGSRLKKARPKPKQDKRPFPKKKRNRGRTERPSKQSMASNPAQHPSSDTQRPNLRFSAKDDFRQFALNDALYKSIVAAGYRNPWPVQRETIGPAVAGKDILALAQTGTGKTAAFVIPILQKIFSQPRCKGPQALVLVPTRELARQIGDVFQQLARFMDFNAVLIYGGVAQRTQAEQLRRRPDLIVACPGRLLDLLKQGIADLRHIHTFVLDEADQLFDMGFLPDIRRIIGRLPKDRQNMFFSATMPKEVRTLADQLLTNPHVVSLGTRTPLSTIKHLKFSISDEEKYGLLASMFTQPEFSSAIVFSRTKWRAKRLAEKLNKNGHQAVALQGNMSQSKRDRAMQGFRDSKYRVLVATDIAARGIDVARVSHVINYDVPHTAEAYTHRIGRTGRANCKGLAYTFVTDADHKHFRTIETQLGFGIPLSKPC